MSEFLTTKEVAKLFNINVQTARRWARKELITGVKKGKSFFFDRATIMQEFQEKQTK